VRKNLRHWLEYLELRDRFPRVRAWLRVLREGESRQDDRAYFIRWGGTRQPSKYFDDLTHHPRILEPGPKGPSSAAGAYQITMSTYDDFAPAIGVKGFSRDEQDALAIAICDEEGALDAILGGNFSQAVTLLGGRWSSLPSNTDGQRTQEYGELEAVWLAYGGGAPATTESPPVEEIVIAEESQEEEKMPIPMIVGVVGTLLSQLIPVVAPLFDKKTETPAKIEAATKVIDLVVKTTGAVNEQEAIQKLQASPELVKATTQAIVTDPTIMPMLEISSAGIEKAREQAIQYVQSADVWWKLVLNPVLIVTFATLPLVYMIVWEMIKHLAKVSGDVIAQTIGTVIGLVLGGIMGFWMGQTYQNMKAERSRSTDAQPSMVK
jgi:muramidase (phage lysozyme)